MVEALGMSTNIYHHFGVEELLIVNFKCVDTSIDPLSVNFLECYYIFIRVNLALIQFQEKNVWPFTSFWKCSGAPKQHGRVIKALFIPKDIDRHELRSLKSFSGFKLQNNFTEHVLDFHHLRSFVKFIKINFIRVAEVTLHFICLLAEGIAVHYSFIRWSADYFAV